LLPKTPKPHYLKHKIFVFEFKLSQLLKRFSVFWL